MMRLHHFLFAAAMLVSSSYSAPADQSFPAQAPQSISFRPVEKTVTLKAGSKIFDRPGGHAIFIVSQAVKALAQGISEDGQWWEITLANGSVGFVSTPFLAD
jgi:hypothetical protein